ncbi:Thioredoxin [Mesobacillus persicus]|uniref:Thioredoxin n=1 Tax=Mesobacillus persicus TaxID=930146 RepID=A0A1H7ZWI6_9BACI|nr:thioredoxin family protein [Mesobacillus persicus]SEM62681.1 Thioredoxin [Mesobacillus persicus]
MIDLSKEDIARFISTEKTGLIYFYTPICGTCQMASKMLEVVAQLTPTIKIGKADLNYMPELAKQFEVISVPCLLIIKDGVIVEKVFAFHSVLFLQDKVNQHLL